MISNRVVYGNFTEKRSLLNTIIDFDADTSTKNNVTSSNDDYLYNEYKYHSVKQRRNYQIGIVLSDIFGRQTPVLTDKSGIITVPFNQGKDKTKFEVKLSGTIPSPFTHYKYFIKEISSTTYIYAQIVFIKMIKAICMFLSLLPK